MNDILNNIRKVIRENIGINVTENDENLLSEKWNVSLAKWIYVIHKLEIEYQYPIVSIIRDNNYDVFTLNNLAKKIMESEKNSF